MSNLRRIQHASRWLRRVLLIIIFAIPIINVLVWLFINELPQMIYKRILPYFVTLPLPFSTRLLGFGVSLMPVIMGMILTYYLMQLFRLYEQGRIFRAPNVRCFKSIAWVLLGWFIIDILHLRTLG
jgi:hypothetical protein